MIHADLTADELRELWLGPGPGGSLFRSREELRAAWTRGRDTAMTLWGKRCRRPQAWWEFESPVGYPGYDHEKSVLYEHGLLTEEERAELIADWRAEFARAQQPDFFLPVEPGKILHGDRARRAHYRWADIPAALVAQWTDERTAA